MKLSTATVIAASILLAGFTFNQPYLWVPLSVLGAAGVDLFTRSWIASEQLGRWRVLSAILKFLFSIIGFYALIGQFACVGLILVWIFF